MIEEELCTLPQTAARIPGGLKMQEETKTNHGHDHGHDHHHHHDPQDVTDYISAVNAYRKTFPSKQDVL